MLQRILVWDLPTRVFHWSFALSFAGAYLTAESERYRDIHLALGYVFLGMLVFRLVWGLVGTAYVRFRAFWFKPAESLLTCVLYLAHNRSITWGITQPGAWRFSYCWPWAC
jgi:Cytochrome b